MSENHHERHPGYPDGSGFRDDMLKFIHPSPIIHSSSSIVHYPSIFFNFSTTPSHE
ncbi:MAG: hypothetical protein U9Q91_04680 [Candidatus Marinimicrobia bacterium]|nr:hypothetical protein [Candidatus Neomarinimicrobiota bacterium]